MDCGIVIIILIVIIFLIVMNKYTYEGFRNYGYPYNYYNYGHYHHYRHGDREDYSTLGLNDDYGRSLKDNFGFAYDEYKDDNLLKNINLSKIKDNENDRKEGY